MGKKTKLAGKYNTVGKYLGYTESTDNKGFPTLYFENGRFTQRHQLITNVGWHPNSKDHYGSNISIRKYNEYFKLKNVQEKDKFKTKFRKGRFDYHGSNAENNAKYFEVFRDPFGKLRAHPSRSFLRMPGNAGFNKQYDQDYAYSKIETGFFQALNSYSNLTEEEGRNLVAKGNAARETRNKAW